MDVDDVKQVATNRPAEIVQRLLVLATPRCQTLSSPPHRLRSRATGARGRRRSRGRSLRRPSRAAPSGNGARSCRCAPARDKADMNAATPPTAGSEVQICRSFWSVVGSLSAPGLARRRVLDWPPSGHRRYHWLCAGGPAFLASVNGHCAFWWTDSACGHHCWQIFAESTA